MKDLIIGLMLAVLVLVSGCASTGGAQPLSPAQVAAIACPQINLAMTDISAINAVLLVSPSTAKSAVKANAELIALQPVVATVCAVGSTVTATDLHALAQQALPALGAIVGTLPLPPAKEAQIQGALVLAETAMGLADVVEQQIQAAKAAQVPVPASTVVSPVVK